MWAASSREETARVRARYGAFRYAFGADPEGREPGVHNIPGRPDPGCIPGRARGLAGLQSLGCQTRVFGGSGFLL